ncbi:MAG: NAD(P)-dependent oxidoreductase [Steroidobacteraceae bacterium]
MKLAIFGSTGSVGRELVKQALEQGHEVTAFARDPAKLGIEHPRLRTVQGNAMDVTSVERAVRGQDAVLCALGAGRKGQVRAEGTRNILRAMEATGVRRLICQSTLGAGDSHGNLNFFWKYVMFGLLLRTAYADHEEQEKYVERSSVDWTLVRPAALADGERTGEYRHGFGGGVRNLQLKISRADVADFMLKQLTDDRYVHRTPGLSY